MYVQNMFITINKTGKNDDFHLTLIPAKHGKIQVKVEELIISKFS